MGKKTIFFDLDDTLYDRSVPYCSAFAAFFGGKYADKAQTAFERTMLRGYEVFEAAHTGQMTMEAMHIYRHQIGLLDVGIRITAAQALQLQAVYAAQQQRITLSAAVRAALDYCREAYRAVGIITNGSVGPQQGKLRSLGLDRWAEAKLVFISDACGVMKPAPEIFRLAQTAAGGGPCVFVGDSCSQDIAGASACGWQTIWLSRTGESPTASPTLTAYAEQDLLPCLQALAE